LPGPGTIYVRQTLLFDRPVGLGDEVTVRVTVAEKRAERHVVLDCLCLTDGGLVAISGQAEVIAPAVKVRRPRVLPPEVHLHERGARHRQLVQAARGFDPVTMAVVHPCDAVSLEGALAARDAGLIVPVLVGPEARIRAVAEAAGASLAGLRILSTEHSHAAAQAAVALARAGEVAALMKGALHTDEIMAAVVDSATGLRTERRISHVFALDVPHYPKPLFITDAAINIDPDLMAKRDIIQNAIDLCHALGIAQPKVAILSAVETVTPAIRSSVEAGALCKMADRGQITGGMVDGPLAFDNAVSEAAARTKGIVSEVAGQADILLAPDMVSGNMLAKQLIHLAGADSAGIALGARVPIVLTSRSDDLQSRVASSALACLVVAHALARARRAG
jgi:phosphotransacetylase